MQNDTDTLIADLRRRCTTAAFDEKAVRGWHLLLTAEPEALPDIAGILRGHGFFLSFITAVHADPCCELVYQFGRYDRPLRAHLRVPAPQGQAVPSLAAVYQGAAWHEREVYDFFGIAFAHHPGLKPLILTRDDKGLNPLLKRADGLKQRAELFSE